MAVICKRCVIEGRVQGVFYRASAHEVAQKFGIFGWIRNRSDGRVESIIQGELEPVEQMQDWFWQGPSNSHVTSVQCYDEKPIATDKFIVTR